MSRPPILVTGFALLLGLASCTAAEGADPQPQLPQPAAAGTSSTAALPATTQPAPADPATPLPDLTLPAPPPGSGQSLNESAGCGAPQGVRGPYAAAEGYVPPAQEVAGPWGALFGRDIAEVTDNLIRMELPSTGGDPVPVWVHERAAPALQRVIDNLLAEQTRGRYYHIEAVSTHRSGTVPPKRYLSFHAVGTAIDVNPDTNPYRADNVLVTDMPDWFVQAWIDAGWCWGGNWQTIKDTMHFSWMGPRYSDDTAAAPIPPRTGPAPFDRALQFETALGPAPADARGLLADIDRDGAPDATRVSPLLATGRAGVVAARAIHHYDTCRADGPTQYPIDPGATVLLADRTGDGRPDLWEVTEDSGHAVVTVYPFSHGYRRRIVPVRTGIAADPGAAFLAGDHDRDGATDLVVIRPGHPTRLEVWAGPAFGLGLRVDLPFPTGGDWRFALGDRHGDGIPDLFALEPSGRLLVSDGASGFAAAPEEITTGIRGHGDALLQAADLDGDGRDDLGFFDPDGTLTVYLGGDRAGTPDDDLLSWFLGRDDLPWEYRDGCGVSSGIPR